LTAQKEGNRTDKRKTEEENETGTNCNGLQIKALSFYLIYQLDTNFSQLKMQSADGKFYKTDVADTEQLFRLIQSIPSPKAEPFKLWLAKVASEGFDEDPTF
jgi:hypothetical protein